MGNFNGCVCLDEPAAELHKSQDWTAVGQPELPKARRNSSKPTAVTLDVLESRRLAHLHPEPNLKRIATQKQPLMLVGSLANNSSPGLNRHIESHEMRPLNREDQFESHILPVSHQFNSPDRLFTSQQINLTSPDRTTSKHALDMTFRDPNMSYGGNPDVHNSGNRLAAVLANSTDFRLQPYTLAGPMNNEESAQHNATAPGYFSKTIQKHEQQNPGHSNYLPIQTSFGREDQFRTGITPRFAVELGPAAGSSAAAIGEASNQMIPNRGLKSSFEPVDNVNKCRQTLKMIESRNGLGAGYNFIQVSTDLDA